MLDNLTQFEPTIIKLAKSYKIPPLTAEDIAQELRLQLWLKRDKFNSKRATYENWAYIVCRNKIKDLAKKFGKEIKTISLDGLKEKGIEIER